MGRKIVIHRVARMKYQKRPEGMVGKVSLGPKTAQFYADDVTWAAAGPIRATHVATPQGMRLINEDGSLGPVEEGVASIGEHAQTLTEFRATHEQRMDVEEMGHRHSMGGVTVTNTRPGDVVHAVLTEGIDNLGRDITPEVQWQTRDYTYFYAGPVPVRRQHNIGGSIDRAEIDHDIVRREVLIAWVHQGQQQPVNVERIPMARVEGVTLSSHHQILHPQTAALSYTERQDILESSEGLSFAADAPDNDLLDAQNGVDRTGPPYTYTYSGGVPIWRVHNTTGEVDSAVIADNDMTDRWDIRWMHYPLEHPVHTEHVEHSAVGEGPGQDGLVDGRTVTIADVHRMMHPEALRQEGPSNMRGPYAAEHDRQTRAVAENAAQIRRRNSDRIANRKTEAIFWKSPALWVYLKMKLDAWRPGRDTLLEKFRHWQDWEKVDRHGERTYVHRGPLTFRAGAPWITFTYIALYIFWVGIPASDLLQLLNQ